MHAPLQILFIGTVFPEPVSSAAGVRTEALLEDFLGRGDRVHFVSPSDANRFSEGLRERGIVTHQIGPNDPAFDTLLATLRPDVVVFDRFMLEEQFGWRVAEHAPSAIRVLDTIDLHFLRRWRGERLKQFLKGTSRGEGTAVSEEDLTFLFNTDIEGLPAGPEGIETDDCLREVASILRSDMSLILSSFEFELLKARFPVPESSLLELGFSYPSPEVEKRIDFSNRKHFVSIGNFRHPPNRDSAFWLSRVLWPEIRERLKQQGDEATEFHLYGAYPPKEIMALDAPKSRFRVFGPAENSIETLRSYRALLAPIRFGAGIKGKIADAWSAGIPVVTTPIGAEGMDYRVRKAQKIFAGFIAKSELEFIESSTALYGDATLQAGLIADGDRAIDAIYSPHANREKFHARLDELRVDGRLEDLRAKNLVGRILRADFHGRTKYFSKWIEAKTKSEPLA